MKTKNDIIDFWKSKGLLNGLKSGSQTEWRCAKSFEDLSNILLNGYNETLNINREYFDKCNNPKFQSIIFPIIRRMICTNKPRLNRIIKPNEIIDALNQLTINDLLKHLDALSFPNYKNIKQYFRESQLIIMNFKKNIHFQYIKNNTSKKLV